MTFNVLRKLACLGSSTFRTFVLEAFQTISWKKRANCGKGDALVRACFFEGL